MARFIYRVKDDTGKTFTGTLEAENAKVVRRKLRDSGYYVVGVSPHKDKGKFVFFERRVSLDTLLMFTHQLSSMIGAGLPILLSLDILWRHIEDTRMQLVISQIKDRLNRGKSLSQAIAEFPKIFPPMYRALLSVAETGGGLVPILKKLVEYLTIQKQVISKIKRASTYPLTVLGFAIGVVILMLTFVVPTFQKVFTKLRIELPALTQLVLKVSALTRSLYFWIVIVVIGVGVFFLYKLFTSRPGLRLKMDRWKLKLPLLGKVFYLASISRFVRSLGLLLGAGLSASKSMKIAKATAINKHIERSLDWVEKRIIEGMSFSEAIGETKMFPNVLVEMVAVGERSGTLVEMLEKMAVHFEEELDFYLNKLLTMLGPALIVLVGGLVVFILIAIYLPIFTLWGKLGMMH